MSPDELESLLVALVVAFVGGFLLATLVIVFKRD